MCVWVERNSVITANGRVKQLPSSTFSFLFKKGYFYKSFSSQQSWAEGTEISIFFLLCFSMSVPITNVPQ
jgi:hypothetical protein